MERKLFCELCPAAYRLSVEKEILRRKLQDLARGPFAKRQMAEPLPVLVYRHKSLIRRRLGQVDMQLQENKAVNLALAAPRVHGVVIAPGETFSFWRMVGRCTARKGYRPGMTIRNGATGQGVGGGMCQFTNLIHWMALHSPLTVVEHHHHDQMDLFPDFGRQVPFGVGTSIAYNYLDYRLRNDTDQLFQLRVWVDGEYLCGELRAQRMLEHTYHIRAEDEYFVRCGEQLYRCNTILRRTVERDTGRYQDQVLMRNRALVLYDASYVDPAMIREEEKTN